MKAKLLPSKANDSELLCESSRNNTTAYEPYIYVQQPIKTAKLQPSAALTHPEKERK